MQFKGGTGFFSKQFISWHGRAYNLSIFKANVEEKLKGEEPSFRLLTHLMDENFGAKFSIIFQSASSSTPLGCILFSSMSLPNSRVNLPK